MKNEELEKLKKSADLSQNLLIEKVESLVRSEYDRDLIEKEIRQDLKMSISRGITSHIRNILDNLLYQESFERYGIANDLKRIFFKIGDIVDGMDEQMTLKEEKPPIVLSEYDRSERSL